MVEPNSGSFALLSVSRVARIPAVIGSLIVGACSAPNADPIQGKLALSGSDVLTLSRDADGRTVATPEGAFRLPTGPAFRTYSPARDTGLPTTTIDFRVRKPQPTPTERAAEPGSFQEAVLVSVHLNSETPRPAYPTSDAETRTLEIDGSSVTLTGENLDCDIGHAPPAPKDSPLLYQPLDGRLIARWMSGGRELHLSCERSVLAGRARMYLNCGGGTDELTFGRFDFQAWEQGEGDCTDALVNLVKPFSYAPAVLEAWRRIQP